MAVLPELEPKAVFKYFEEICAIPHGSYHTDAISLYLEDFAKEHSLKYRRDESNNVVIFKPATPGYESAPPVMIQGHMDMVCEKLPGCTKNMEEEGLELFIDGDTIGARGTTLGGDDGIAVAMGLAILDADDIPHGPLECLFTVDEEVGMIGARALDASDLKAQCLLNIDSEADKVLTVSCAGSTRAVSSFEVKREEFHGTVAEIKIEGLIGGHSGEEIHKGRANANILLGRALFAVSKVCKMRVISLQGGAKDNAIPCNAYATVSVSDFKAAENCLSELQEMLRTEYRTADSNISVSFVQVKSEEIPFNENLSRRITAFLFCVPNGVQMMSMEVPNLVQTSLNLGRLFMENNNIIASFMVRSSVNSQKDEVTEKLRSLTEILGGSFDVPVSYSAWEYKPDSPLRDTMVEAFREVYGEEPKIEALHAGLECGILLGKMPWLDCISFGPDLTDIHTPRERLHIRSAQRVWNLTLETLKRLK